MSSNKAKSAKTSRVVRTRVASDDDVDDDNTRRSRVSVNSVTVLSSSDNEHGTGKVVDVDDFDDESEVITSEPKSSNVAKGKSSMSDNKPSAGRTRSSNGITKKRQLPDAATLSDDHEQPASVSPTKKSRLVKHTPTSRVHDADVDNTAYDNDANTRLALSSLKLTNTTTRRKRSEVASPASPSPPTSPLMEPLDITKSATKRPASRFVKHREDTPGDESLEPEELASMSRAIIDSKMNATDGHSSDDDITMITPQKSKHTSSSTSTVPTRNNKTVSSGPDGSSSADGSGAVTSTKPRRLFKAVYPPSKTTPIMSNGPVLLSDSLRFSVMKLPSHCEVSFDHLQDVALKDDYASLPPLAAGKLIAWSGNLAGSATPVSTVTFSEWANQCPDLDYDLACDAVRFTRYYHFVNPSRASPLIVNILYSHTDLKKSTLQCNMKTAICLSPILTEDSYLLTPSSHGLKNKYISGYMHKQEWERFVGFVCMAFDRPALVAQIHHDAIQFGTIGSAYSNRESASPSKPRNPNILSVSSAAATKSAKTNYSTNYKSVLDSNDTIPVYDCRNHPFDFTTDLDNLDMLPRYDEEVPSGSFAVVAYTLGHYENAKDKRPTLTTNILFVVLLSVPPVN